MPYPKVWLMEGEMWMHVLIIPSVKTLQSQKFHLCCNHACDWQMGSLQADGMTAYSRQNDSADRATSTWHNYGIQIHNYVITAYGSFITLWKHTSAPSPGWDSTSSHHPHTGSPTFACDGSYRLVFDLARSSLPEANSLRQAWRELYTSLPIFPEMPRRTHANWTYKLRSVYLENQSLVAFKRVLCALNLLHFIYLPVT